MSKDKKFLFQKKEPKPEKLPTTLEQIKDSRQKQADEGLKRTNLYLLGIAGLLGLVLIILAIAKGALLH